MQCEWRNRIRSASAADTRTRHRAWRWLIVALMATCSHCVTQASDGPEGVGVSLQATARGGADIAVGDTALSQIDNPATIALQPWNQWSMDTIGQYTIVDGPWQTLISSSDSTRNKFLFGNTGFTFPAINDRWKFGFATHGKCGLGAEYMLRPIMMPWTKRRMHSDMKVINFSFNAAYRASEKLSLGFGGRFEVAEASFSQVLGPLDLDFGRGRAYGGGFQVGLHYQARDDLAFALAYRSPTWFTDLSGGDGKLSLLGLPELNIGQIEINKLLLPQKITAGVAWDATDWLKLVGEVRWINWKNSVFNNMSISTNGAIDLTIPYSLGYRDQWVFILGADMKLDEHWTLGLGYHYATNPVPDAYLQPIAAIISQHHATVGLTYRKDNWWAGVSYMCAFPAHSASSGISKIPLGIDYGFSELGHTQHTVSFGFGFSW